MASKESKHHEVKNNSNESSSNRLKALDAALGQIDKQFGKGSIMRMGEKDSMTIASIPTGALPLDIALGIGGYPTSYTVWLAVDLTMNPPDETELADAAAHA